MHRQLLLVSLPTVNNAQRDKKLLLRFGDTEVNIYIYIYIYI